MDESKEALPRFTLWLRRQTQRRGWSGSELARQMGIKPGTANNWLSGRRMLTDRELIRRMADVLNVHQDEILEQLDMRDGGADRMSPAVRRLQPLIDSIEWDEGAFNLVEGTLENVRKWKEMMPEVPKMENEE